MDFLTVKANIIDVVADVVVLPANESLKEGSGASSAIFEAAGRKQLTKACKELRHCNTGSAVPTLAYDLNAKFIVHAVVPKWIDGNHNEYELLSSAYIASLNIAEVMGCESIAFPLLASGNNKFDKELAVRIAAESISSFEGVNLKKVYLVVYGETMEVFMRGLGYEVTTVPEAIRMNENKAERKDKFKKVVEAGIDVAKEVGQIVLEVQKEQAINWIKDPENQKMVIDKGIAVVKCAAKLVVAKKPV